MIVYLTKTSQIAKTKVQDWVSFRPSFLLCKSEKYKTKPPIIYIHNEFTQMNDKDKVNIYSYRSH